MTCGAISRTGEAERATQPAPPAAFDELLADQLPSWAPTPRHPAISWQPGAVKKIGRIPDDGGGARTAEEPPASHRSTKVGFDYVHSLVDDHSQLAYSEVLTDEKGPTCAGFLARAAAYFAAHGITRLERVMTDAWAYKWSLRGIIGDRNTYTSIYPGGNGVHAKLRGFLTGGGGATSETKLSGAAP